MRSKHVQTTLNRSLRRSNIVIKEIAYLVSEALLLFLSEMLNNIIFCHRCVPLKIDIYIYIDEYPQVKVIFMSQINIL